MANQSNDFLLKMKQKMPNSLLWRVPFLVKRKEFLGNWETEDIDREIALALEGSIGKSKAETILKNVLKEYPTRIEEFLSYHVLFKRLDDKEYPRQPFYRENYKKVLHNFSEEKIGELESTWIEHWNQERKDKYLTTKNVVYDKDFTKEWITSTKHPVIGKQSLSHFYDKLYYRISKSHEDLKLESETFLQTMFGFDKNGKLLRFLKVIEINPDFGDVNQTFDWSISIKLMPDDNLEHSSCIFRFDSKREKHKDAHFHFFTRRDLLRYLCHPTTCTPVKLKKIITLCKEDIEDKSTLPYFVQVLLQDKKLVKALEILQQELVIADRKIQKDRMCKYKDGWFRKFACLKYANTIIDVVMNIEKEKVFDKVKNDLYSMDDEPVYTQDEYMEQLISYLQEKKEEDSLISAEEELQQVILLHEQEKSMRANEISELEKELKIQRELWKQRDKEKREHKRQVYLDQQERTQEYFEKLFEEKKVREAQKREAKLQELEFLQHKDVLSDIEKLKLQQLLKYKQNLNRMINLAKSHESNRAKRNAKKILQRREKLEQEVSPEE